MIMKKKYVAVAAALLAATMPLLTACSKNSANLSDYDLEKYVELCEYKGVKVTRKVINVDDDDIADAVDDLLDEYAETVTLNEDDILQLYDKVTIKYVGNVNGEYEGLENGEEIANTDNTSKKSETFSIGRGGYIPGFEDKMIGRHPGESFEFDIVFPEGYKNRPALGGATVTFKIEVVSATRDVQPEYNDAFVAAKTDYNTVEEYEAYLFEKLRAEADEEEMLKEITDVWEYVMDNSKVIRYPEAVVEAQINSYMDMLNTAAKSYSMTTEELVKAQFGLSMTEFETKLDEQCRRYVFEQMVLGVIIAREGITISDAEYTEGLADYAAKNGETDVSKFEAEYGADTIRESLLWDKVLKYLLEKAVVSDETSN